MRQMRVHLVGPVAQFMPSTLMPMRSMVVSTDAISVPTSKVPVVSTVAWTQMGILV